jgi:hypothetical protein
MPWAGAWVATVSWVKGVSAFCCALPKKEKMSPWLLSTAPWPSGFASTWCQGLGVSMPSRSSIPSSEKLKGGVAAGLRSASGWTRVLEKAGSSSRGVGWATPVWCAIRRTAASSLFA